MKTWQLSDCDIEFVRRDPDLPGLATVLNPDAFVAALRRVLARADLGTARIIYVTYRPRTSCLVHYQLDVAGTAVPIYATAWRLDAQAEFRTPRDQAPVPGPLGPGRVVLEDCAVGVSIFPNDRQVTGLPYFADAEARRHLLRALVPNDPDLWQSTVRSLAYRAEQRYVAQLLSSDQERAAVKLYTAADYDAALAGPTALRSRGPLRLARLLGRCDGHRTLALEWLPGRLLSEIIAGPDLDPEAAVAAGRALAELHAQAPTGLPCWTREAEAASLCALATRLGWICPHLAARADGLARRLATRLRHEPPVNRPLHGDFHPKQVLLAGDSVAFLDLDRAVRGDPAADLGHFLAYLEHGVLRGKFAPPTVELLRDALLAGYRPATEHITPARVDLYTAVELFRRVRYPFRHHEPDWPQRIEAILERAEAIAHRALARAYTTPRGRDLRRTQEN